MSGIRYLLPNVKTFFKANLHTHSTISDGRLKPQELKEIYKSRGYSILCLTDHNMVADHSDMNEPDFLMLTGVEVNTSQKVFHSRKKTYHLNLIAKRPDLLWQPFPRVDPTEDALPHVAKAQVEGLSNECSPEAVNAVIAAANEKGFLVSYNHPGWSLQEYPDYAPLKGLWAMELVNYGSTFMGYDDRDNSRVYRDLISLGTPVVPLGTDDCHSARDVCGAWTMIGAESLAYGDVIRAMEKGDLYASTGPEIHALTLEDNILTVRCSDARAVTLESSNRFARSAKPIHNDGLLREAQFDITPWRNASGQTQEDWLRIVVHGPYGHYAATRAYFRKELD